MALAQTLSLCVGWVESHFGSEAAAQLLTYVNERTRD
jgi:hypothetical protein